MSASVSDQELEIYVDGFASDVEHSDVGGASASDVTDQERPGTSRDISHDIVNETLVGEDDEGNVSDVQESQFEHQPRRPVRSVSDLSGILRMRSESGDSHHEDEG